MKQHRKKFAKSDKVLRKKSTVDLVRELANRLGNTTAPMELSNPAAPSPATTVPEASDGVDP